MSEKIVYMIEHSKPEVFPGYLKSVNHDRHAVMIQDYELALKFNTQAEAENALKSLRCPANYIVVEHLYG